MRPLAVHPLEESRKLRLYVEAPSGGGGGAELKLESETGEIDCVRLTREGARQLVISLMSAVLG